MTSISKGTRELLIWEEKLTKRRASCSMSASRQLGTSSSRPFRKRPRTAASWKALALTQPRCSCQPSQARQA